MTNAIYVVAGYVGTAATVAAYAWSIRNRTRQVERILPRPPVASAATPNAATSGRDTVGDTAREG